jgi:NLR family CARD domain-containing protein 3
MQAISSIIAQCTNLRVFRIFFSYNRVRNAGISCIANALEKLTKVEILDLRFFENQIAEEGCKAFEDLQDISFINVKYLNISLGNNSVSDEGCRYLAKFLSGMRNLKQLSVFLESNAISSNGILHLSRAFLRKN